MKITYKGDPDRIELFQAKGINGPFEIFYRGDKDFNRKVENAAAVHFYDILPDGKRIDLSDTGEMGDISEKELAKVIEFAVKNNIPKVVFHPPSTNIFKRSKKEAIDVLASRLNRINRKEVLLCIENVCLWINQIYTNEPLLTTPEDYFKIKNVAKIPLGFVFDVEHFCVTSTMKLFYDDLKDDFISLNQGKTSYDQIRIKFENIMKKYLEKNDIKEHCHSFIKNALNLLKNEISHVHCCGSDFTKYYYNNKSGFPIVGEHLPLGYNGTVEGKPVTDRLDHNIWVQEVKDKDINVVMEISPREEYDSIESIKKSESIIRGLI